VVENATQEGILVMRTAYVTIPGNLVRHNDLGASAEHPTGACAPQGQVPADGGEGVHLMTVANSEVLGNLVTRNAGGILLTDELGPTYRNIVAGNHVYENPFDCGITVAGRNGNAVAHGTVKPDVGGIYENKISANVSDRNGGAARAPGSSSRQQGREQPSTRMTFAEIERPGTTFQGSRCTATPPVTISTATTSPATGFAMTTWAATPMQMIPIPLESSSSVLSSASRERSSAGTGSLILTSASGPRTGDPRDLGYPLLPCPRARIPEMRKSELTVKDVVRKS
jgi:hypothetical protein